MLEILADIISPHYCVSCGQIGQLLCDYCKYDIASEHDERCVVCKQLATGEGICGDCRPKTTYTRAWAVCERDAVVTRLIDSYKSDCSRSALVACVDLLDAALPVLPSDVVVLPVPTIRAHIRQRGYAHAELIARGLARRRGLAYQQLVSRAASHVQRGSTRAERLLQASESYTCDTVLDGGLYLVVDDVVTTGATLEYMAQSLRDSGADAVWVAVVARQPTEMA